MEHLLRDWELWLECDSPLSPPRSSLHQSPSLCCHLCSWQWLKQKVVKAGHAEVHRAGKRQVTPIQVTAFRWGGCNSLGSHFALGHIFPSGSDSKESVSIAGDTGSIPGSGRHPEGNGYPLQYSCLENYGQMTGARPLGSQRATVYGITELDMTEGLTISFHFPLN